MTHEQAIDKIFNDTDLAISVKVIRLYSLAMLNYRQPTGDRAWKKIRDLIGGECTTALAFLTGASMGSTLAETPHWDDLVPELAEESVDA